MARLDAAHPAGVVLDNLRLAFPDRSEDERRAIARVTYRNLGRKAAEFLLLRHLGREALDRIFVYDGGSAPALPGQEVGSSRPPHAAALVLLPGPA